MRIHVPYDLANRVYIDFNVEYDVIATAGPPSPPFDVKITSFTFVERWQHGYNACDGTEVLDTFEDYADLGYGTCCSPYDGFIKEYLENNAEEIRRLCREFELTTSDAMV